MEYKIYDSELKVLELLWEGGELSANEPFPLVPAMWIHLYWL